MRRWPMGGSMSNERWHTRRENILQVALQQWRCSNLGVRLLNDISYAYGCCGVELRQRRVMRRRLLGRAVHRLVPWCRHGNSDRFGRAELTMRCVFGENQNLAAYTLLSSN